MELDNVWLWLCSGLSVLIFMELVAFVVQQTYYYNEFSLSPQSTIGIHFPHKLFGETVCLYAPSLTKYHFFMSTRMSVSVYQNRLKSSNRGVLQWMAWVAGDRINERTNNDNNNNNNNPINFSVIHSHNTNEFSSCVCVCSASSKGNENLFATHHRQRKAFEFKDADQIHIYFSCLVKCIDGVSESLNTLVCVCHFYCVPLHLFTYWSRSMFRQFRVNCVLEMVKKKIKRKKNVRIIM